MQNIVILGAGMVGGAIAADLSDDFRVTVADRDRQRLTALAAQYPLATAAADLSDPGTVKSVIKDADLVVGAVPGFMGFETLKTVIEAGKNTVDISFFAEDPFLLDEAAAQQGVTAVMDCGVAPGMSNMILGHYNERIKIDRFRCLVGGLPAVRTRPWEYKAPFSPIDVIEEYIRPARIVENGSVVTRPALSEPELIEFDRIGTLEAFNTDGLRSLIRTMNIPDMSEKTLRYPGHIEKIRLLKETGFFSPAPVDIGGTPVKPLELTTRLLFPLWKLEPQEEEFTVMRITIEGTLDGSKVTAACDLLDRNDPVSGMSSMSRTTGYPCTAVARLILAGEYVRPGISPPEFVGARSGCLEKVLQYLRERNIDFRIKEN